ncbi:PocR ligand-binding domain-containing protein [Anaeromicropila herbilytica]|uniref:AraC family transcriptional regulator n=1 Tax=Anaeromicropila herbilytica TaxID=2785025 RepID=A0A7R7EMP8_9FIRM|nr:PocR ligand-binding domain-containing protein [Anaeromicropila herbilytica]BCN31644.1 AraC family transcriptional regulator [Anaeromicropila herbilytica]
MKNTFTDIGQIVNPVKFQKIQDDMALATDLAIITVDYKGKPLTKHSNCSEFCQKVRSSEYGIYCESCDSHGGLEAARLRTPYIYTCHAGLVDFAIPILVNDLYLGAFMAGQVLLSPNVSEYETAHIPVGVINTISPMKNNFKEAYDMLPIMSIEKITSLANMLLHIGNYCVKEAELKTLLSQRASKYGAKDNYVEPEDDDRMLRTANHPSKKDSNVIIKRALNYIKDNPSEKITLENMAALCNISPSYFSKLFAKENLGTLSDYVNLVKANHAKELLANSDWSIRVIASQVGFDDSGYFIKVFKKHTGQTPVEYRESQLRNS